MYQSSQTSNAGPEQGIDPTLDLSALTNTGSPKGDVRHLSHQESVFSPKLQSEIIERQSTSNTMFQGSASSTGNPLKVSFQLVFESAKPGVAKFGPLVDAMKHDVPQSNSAVVSAMQLGRTHERDRDAIKRYGEEMVQTYVPEVAKRWKEESIPCLLATSQYIQGKLNKAITDFMDIDAPWLKELLSTEAWESEKSLRYTVKTELVSFFDWYNKNRDKFDTTSHDSTTMHTEERTVIQSGIEEWLLAARDEISCRTGISRDDIQGVSFKSRINGLPLFISNATVTNNSFAEKDLFLRHATPLIVPNGSGLASLHSDDTAYSVLLQVNPGTGEVRRLEIMAVKLDPGGAHPDTLRTKQLARSLFNRHNPGWLPDAMNNIQQRTKIEASAIGYVHYLGKDGNELFMTNDTAASVNCDAYALADFFCFVEPTLYSDGSGKAEYVQNGEKHSVDFRFNPQTGEITSFQLTKPMDIDMTEA